MFDKTLFLFAALCAATFLASCQKEKEPDVRPYTVPTTYSFGNADFSKSAKLTKMLVEMDAYLKKANAGSMLVPLDQAVLNNMFANTAQPFADVTLNDASFSISGNMDDATYYKSLADSVLVFNTGVNAAPGVGGFVPRSANKIVVGPTGLEYAQAFVKGTMSTLFFKEAVRLLNSVKSVDAADTTAAQAIWDEAFGYLSVPANYDTAATYAGTDPNRPVLWGGYLAERGTPIQAGSVIFNAFLKGRAAIGGYDVNVRNEQVDIILDKWEQLAAIAVLTYVTTPTASTAIGNYGTQLHALSEGFGFLTALKYRSSRSNLSAADYTTLNRILHTDFYVLLNQSGFTDLVTAQNILQTTYGL